MLLIRLYDFFICLFLVVVFVVVVVVAFCCFCFYKIDAILIMLAGGDGSTDLIVFVRHTVQYSARIINAKLLFAEENKKI